MENLPKTNNEVSVDKHDDTLSKNETNVGEIPNDRYENISPYSKEVPFDKDKEYHTVQISGAKYSSLVKMLDMLEHIDPETLKELFSNEDLITTGLNTQSTSNTVKKDVYYETMNDRPDDWVNDIVHGDKKLNIDNINIKASGNLSGGVAVSKFTSSLGIGAPSSIPLWHSGFTVTIRPPLDTDLVKLELAIADNEISLGRQTNALIYSNYSVVLVRMVVDFLIEHIISSTLEVPNDKDIRDYIKVPDLYPLILGLIKAKYPIGYDIIKTCKNSLSFEDNKPLCNYTASDTIDPKWLLRVDRKAITDGMRRQMSKKRPNTLTVDDVTEYQLQLSQLKNKDFILTMNGVDVTMTLSTPTLNIFIDNGEEWIDNVITRSQEIFTESDNDDVKNKKVTQILNSVILGIYNIYISKITIGDDIYTDRTSINDNIDVLSSDDSVFTTYIDNVTKYISNSVIAIVATPAFICKTCEEAGRDATQYTHESDAFKEFIPLNTLEHFFDLGGLKVSQIQKRDIS